MNSSAVTATSPLTTASTLSAPQSQAPNTRPTNAPTAYQTPNADTSNGSIGAAPPFPQYSAQTAEILKRVSANALGTHGWEAARERVLKSMVTSENIAPPPPAAATHKRGRGDSRGGATTAKGEGAVGASSSPAVGRGRDGGRGRGRGGGRGGKRKRATSEDASDDANESDVSNSYTTLLYATRSGPRGYQVEAVGADAVVAISGLGGEAPQAESHAERGELAGENLTADENRPYFSALPHAKRKRVEAGGDNAGEVVSPAPEHQKSSARNPPARHSRESVTFTPRSSTPRSGKRITEDGALETKWSESEDSAAEDTRESPGQHSSTQDLHRDYPSAIKSSSSSVSTTSSIPPKDQMGALHSPADKTWDSAATFDQVLDIFWTNDLCCVDDTIVSEHERQGKPLRIKPDEHTLIHLLPMYEHPTVAFVNLKTGVVEHMENLRENGDDTLPARIRSALERVTALVSQEERLQQLQWTFVAQDCAKRDNAWDRGVHMLATVLHRMARIPQPTSIDTGLWGRVFRAAVSNETASAEIVDTLPSGEVVKDLPASQVQHHDGSGLDPGLDSVLGGSSRAYANVNRRFAKYQRNLQDAKEKLQHAQVAHTVLLRLLENAKDAQRRLAKRKGKKAFSIQFHELMRAELERLEKKPEYDADSDPPTDAEDALRNGRVLIKQGVDKLTSEIGQIAQEEEKTSRRRNAVLAAMKTLEAEKDARYVRTTTLEELVKSAATELDTFYAAEIQVCQARLQDCQKYWGIVRNGGLMPM
ncbi:hypothetical protein H2201_008848 [Coniosporium apollinis]|uniref:Uncharacterized protein n=1 Tax=Coniosporium apollinis TaxID=61459 RepID=A0ABQ9NHU4_9PEZI|nr:hypothetical protein H2201_008848 [Coniosporium apollinis]